MKVIIYYFAAVRELVGLSEETLEVPASVGSVEQLLELLCKRHPSLILEGVRIARNEEFCAEDAPLSDGDVIALIPPVSGG